MFHTFVKLSLCFLVSSAVRSLELDPQDSISGFHPNSVYRFAGSDDTEVEFLLFTKDNLQDPDTVKVDDEGPLFGDRLDVRKPTKVIIHGWLDTWEANYAQTMIKSFLPKFDYNVIVVNWPEADSLLYFPSRDKVPAVGAIVGRLLERLRDENDLDLSTTHVIGHSLGAHVGAVAGYSMKGSAIGKITGLDPALPSFDVGGPDTLSRKAADFVEVVHTCGKVWGILPAIGHVDFYPNGGVPFQPGCFLGLSCSHKRSYIIYSEAIGNSTAFQGTECSDWETYKKGGCKENEKIFLSVSTPITARGQYYLKTAASPPYGLGPQS